jgi:two-component system osmolarity sensor histidine kinase EnvZ
VSPRRLQTRLLLLLTVVVIAALGAAALAFGLSMRETNAMQLARGLQGQVMAADALIAAHLDADGRVRDAERLRADLRPLGIEWRDALPPGERASLPLMTRAETRLGELLPGRPLRISGAPYQLWVQAATPARGWIGSQVLGGPEPLRRGLVVSLMAIGLLILVAAWWFARSLARPLQGLAEAAPGIVAGEPPPPPPRGASAEVVDLQRALTAAAERTQAAARDRELMLAGLSHDMRTPLARLRYALALNEAALDPTAQAAMEGDIDEIDAIVGQFIDYVRDGRDEAEDEVDLAALLQALTQREALAGRHWRVTAPQAAPLRGRPLALQRALDNLLANAARHGAAPFEAELVAEASADGRVSLQSSPPKTQIWRLTVRDRGPGVPAEQLAELGRPFHRVDRARGSPGSGLGLASVARVAALHQGELRLRNREDGGFEAELRLAVG